MPTIFQCLRLIRDVFLWYSLTEMVKQISPAAVDITQITVRLPGNILAKLERLATRAVQTKSQFLTKLLQEIPELSEVKTISEVTSEEPSPVKKEPELTALQQRICTWFRRKLTTRWTDKETRSYRQNAHQTPADDVKVLEEYYLANIPPDTDYRRKDLASLLRNWPGELDRARAFIAGIVRKRANIGQGWLAAQALNSESGKNLTVDEVKAGIAELRSKMGLGLVENPAAMRDAEPNDFEGMDL